MALVLKILVLITLVVILFTVSDYLKYNDGDRMRRSAKAWADSLQDLKQTERDLQYLIEQKIDTTQNK